MAISVASFPIISRETPIVVFTNPFARQGRSASNATRARQVFDEAGIPTELESSATLEEFSAKVNQKILRNQQLLLVLGGDGSFHHLVNVTLGRGVVVGLLPAGGGNDFAAALKLRKDFSDIPQLIREQKTISVDALRVRTAEGLERLCMVNAGAGLDAEAAHLACTKYHAVSGRFRYVLSALQALLKLAPQEMQIEFLNDVGRTIRETLLLASTLNVPTCGGGIRVAPNAELTDGLMDIALLKKLDAIQVLRILPGLILNGEVRSSKLMRIQASSVKITTERSCLFQGDGEILGHTPAEIELVPQAIRVLAGL